MVSRKTILVEAHVSGSGWTPGTAAAIHQAGLLASSSQAAVHLMTTEEEDDSTPSPIRSLHEETASAFENLGVEMTSPVLAGGKSRGAGGQPAPLSFAFLSLPDLINQPDCTHRNQILEECRNDVWLAAPQAFDSDIPCLVVYDDLSFHGEQALRAAVSLAQQFQSRLLVVHAIPDENAEGLKSEIEATMQARLFGTDFRTLDQGVRQFVGNGTVEQVLQQAVEQFDGSLVIFSWPHGPVQAESLPTLMTALNNANCSMLLIRTPDSLLRMASA